MEILPDDLWSQIFELHSFFVILLMHMVNRKFRKLTLIEIGLIQDVLRKRPYKISNLRQFKTTGNSPKEMKLLWALKDTNFNTDPVSDQQPRNANRGFGFINNKWIWIRGPFSNRKERIPKVNIFQEDTIISLCKHLKRYEVQYMCDFIDKYGEGIHIFIGDPSYKTENNCIIF